jgi:hypothetical protein
MREIIEDLTANGDEDSYAYREPMQFSVSSMMRAVLL